MAHRRKTTKALLSADGSLSDVFVCGVYYSSVLAKYRQLNLLDSK